MQSPAPPAAPEAKSAEEENTRDEKSEGRGLEIERRASTIPPALLHAVFEVSPEPPAPLETAPPPRAAHRSQRPQAHFSRPPPPPRPSARPLPAEIEEDSIDTRFSLLSGAAVPVLSAPPTDTAAPPPSAPPRRTVQWFAVGAAALLFVLAGVLLGARTRDAPKSAHVSPERAASVHIPPALAPEPIRELELPTEPPGALPVASVVATSEVAAAATAARESEAFAAPVSPREPAARPNGSSASAAAAELPSFDAVAASSAITAAFQRAAACRSPTDPGGSVTATLTYAPSGRITTALVSGPFAGTRIGGCIAGHLRSARVPAFSGDYTTVKRSVVLR